MTLFQITSIADKHGILELKKHFENIKPSIDYKEILANNIEGRIDLTDLKTFTIDPVDAKDFDDAISVTKNNGCIDLYVHIADVSAFIGPEDETDAVARKLGNSYYFDEETLHMLPEELINQLFIIKTRCEKISIFGKD